MSFWNPPNAGSKVAWGISIPIFNDPPMTGVINFDIGTFTLGSYNGDIIFTQRIAFLASSQRIWFDCSQPTALMNFSYNWTSYLHTLDFFMLSGNLADSGAFYWMAVGD